MNNYRLYNTVYVNNTMTEDVNAPFFISSGKLLHLYPHHSHSCIQTESPSDEIHRLQIQVRHVDMSVVKLYSPHLKNHQRKITKNTFPPTNTSLQMVILHLYRLMAFR